MKKFVIGGAAAALIAGSAALAQPGAQAPAAAPKVHSRASVQDMVARNFARLDANRDGFVTRAEADAAKASHAGKWAERTGKRSGAMFDRLDANRDGSIARAEFDAARAKRVANRDKDGDGRPDARGKHGGRGGHGFAALGGQKFDAADANRDARVSLQEATGAALRHFDLADVNRDGQLSPDERTQVRKRLRAGSKVPG